MYHQSDQVGHGTGDVPPGIVRSIPPDAARTMKRSG